jgi:hypothetical protein
MSQQNRTDPLDELRSADPVHHSPAPSESKARVWARIQEVTMDDNTRNARRRTVWGGGLAAAAVAGVAIFALLLNNGDGAPTPTDGPGPGIGSCVETYSQETLANRDFAFDGTVIAIDGDQVTFDVGQSFVGDVTGSITLTASGMTGTSVTSAGGPNLAAGERYLVAGDETFVWACGFTQAYDEAVAADWAEAAR